jgi:hypothetical protein
MIGPRSRPASGSAVDPAVELASAAGPAGLPVLGLAEIERAARPELVLDAVRAPLVAHAEGPRWCRRRCT